ncbi:cysteine proteinase [Xylona heveae TC161]|uniref:ubiquitinyl hydrolase 1 n=1 Tax=Xylona heveae (strain CBS 132557 / TC161) TaxID=1328760 RepID=A0A165I8R6_XYLHT|nr:cysteine proteinase [Xylona heveae TC161]KZF24550.1 cysteine proteinase [Xylona heveae TC161]
MSAGPGKTPPRLIQDLLNFDPRRPLRSGRNVLIDSPPQFQEGQPLPDEIPKESCRHSFVTKYEQSVLPPVGASVEPFNFYKLGAFCQYCRCHVDLVIDLRGHGAGSPCPTRSAPLHHLQYKPELSTAAKQEPLGHGDEYVDFVEHAFECSIPTCAAGVRICMKRPRLSPDFVRMLTDPNVIRERAESAINSDPERMHGQTVPTPIEVMTNLRQYINDSTTRPENTKIPSLNKRFMTSIGESCQDLLEYLGFSRAEDYTGWILPRPDRSSETPYKDPLRLLLDDVEKELLVLISLRPAEEKRGRHVPFLPPPSLRDIEGLLGSLDYDKTPSARRTVDLTVAEHPFYASLGTVSDFSDGLLIYAFDRQIWCDRVNAPYYLECLEGLSQARRSEALQTKVAVMESQGEISRKEIRQAYSFFNLDPSAMELDDDLIIGTFQARIQDAPRQDEEARRLLKVIAQDRNSRRIQQVASETVTTYQQALAWLGAEESTPDDFIVTMFTLKANESDSGVETGRQAISLIAEKRNSQALRSWLMTGELGEVEMDVGQAYNRLGISDRTIDDDMIMTAYQIHADEAKSQIPELRKALIAIAKSKGSRRLDEFLGISPIPADDASNNWPVGLENIGNTCYLNSLLQFYFTVRPLRDLVLNIEQYETDQSPEMISKKRVGSRRVSLREVVRAQKFAHELRKLFQNMITARAAAILPEHELARLTLISSSHEEAFRRMSMASRDTRPSLGELDRAPVFGPLGPPHQHAEAMEVDESLSAMNSLPEPNGDGGSESTVVGTPKAADNTDEDFAMIDSDEMERQKRAVEDKENLSPTKELPSSYDAHSHQRPLRDSSPSKVNEQGRSVPWPNENDPAMANGAPLTPPPENQAPPLRPPPIPPRPKPQEKSQEERQAIKDEVEIGAQQDVTEVIANVMFQLQCAIKPESIDTDGEQIDTIKRLFYGKAKTYTKKGRKFDVKEEFFSDIKVDVASGPRDIYSALDGAFDVQQVDVEDSITPQYATISVLPPILQIQVQRVQFDPVKKTAYKSNSHLQLEETIFLDRYMDSDNVKLFQRREEVWRWKAELSKLEARKAVLTKTDLGIELTEALQLTNEYLTNLQSGSEEETVPVHSDLPRALEDRAAAIQQELTSMEQRSKDLRTQISSQYTDLRKLRYRLHSVFIHRGSVSFGHYWIYIYDFKQQLWRKYNDGYVTEVKDPKEIFYQESQNPATPYFLVYVRDEDKDDLVDAVCRDVPPQQSERANSDEGGTMHMEDVRHDYEHTGGSSSAVTTTPTQPEMMEVPNWGGARAGPDEEEQDDLMISESPGGSSGWKAINNSSTGANLPRDGSALAASYASPYPTAFKYPPFFDDEQFLHKPGAGAFNKKPFPKKPAWDSLNNVEGADDPNLW